MEDHTQNKQPRKFYDARKTISYNAPLTMVVTARSRGKTYGFTVEAIEDYIKRGRKQFVYVRRYVSELQASAPKIFDDVQAHGLFSDWEFRADSHAGYIRRAGTDDKWDTICHMVALSRQQTYKGVAFPRVRKIIFDEFIREVKTPPGYLRDDVGSFLNLYKTVSRDREDVRAYLLANAVDLTNPYFAFAGIKTEPKTAGFSWHNNKTILLHYEKDAEFEEQERETVVGRLISGTPYESAMIRNEFANADDRFIARKPPRAKCWCGLVYRSWRFGVWMDERDGIYYVNERIAKDAMLFTLSASDNSPNILMIQRASPLAKKIVSMYYLGVVRFDTPATRERFLQMLALLGIR